MEIRVIKKLLTEITGIEDLLINRFSGEMGNEVLFRLDAIEQTRNLFTSTVIFLSKSSYPDLAEAPLRQIIDNAYRTNIFFNDNKYQLVLSQPLGFTAEFEDELENGEFLYSTSVLIKIFKLEDEGENENE